MWYTNEKSLAENIVAKEVNKIKIFKVILIGVFISFNLSYSQLNYEDVSKEHWAYSSIAVSYTHLTLPTKLEV